MDMLSDVYGLVDDYFSTEVPSFGKVFMHLFYALFLYAQPCVLIFYLYHCYNVYYYDYRPENHRGCIKGKRVLVVIAHPDDECMFFGPTIVALTKEKDVDVHLMCLSEGDYYGDGETRTQELWASCEVLGIPSNNIRIFSYEHLPDDPLIDWDPNLIASLISWHVDTLSMDTILTFDNYGVSSHRNHIAISNGVNSLLAEGKLPSTCKCYALKSENIFIKYIGFFIVFLKGEQSDVYSCSYNDHKQVLLAMTKHASQYVWFRKLFVKFSSYCYLNTLIPLHE